MRNLPVTGLEIGTSVICLLRPRIGMMKYTPKLTFVSLLDLA